MNLKPMPRRRARFDIIEDIERPLIVARPKVFEPIAVRERKGFLLHERNSQGRRTVIRIVPEVYCRARAAGLGYIKLPNEHMLLSCPTPGQARAAIALIQQVIRSLDGKWLDESGLD